MRRTVTAALIASALSVVITGTALAGRPTITNFEISDAFDIDCGAFLLHEEFTIRGQEKVWYDNEGNPTRTHVHAHWDGLITGPGGIGSLADPAHFTEFTVAPGDDVGRQVGLVYSLHAPGVGLIAHDVGTITFLADGSVEYNGPHDVFEEGLEPLICPLFED